MPIKTLKNVRHESIEFERDLKADDKVKHATLKVAKQLDFINACLTLSFSYLILNVPQAALNRTL